MESKATQNKTKAEKVLFAEILVCLHTRGISLAVSSVVFHRSKGNHVAIGGNSKKKRVKMSKFVFLVAIVSMILVHPSDASAIRSDDKNIAKLLNNQVIVSRQIMCVLDKSPCDQLGRQLKGR